MFSASGIFTRVHRAALTSEYAGVETRFVE